MKSYRITFARRESEATQCGDRHVSALGTGRSRDRFDTLWSLGEALQAMDLGAVFYVKEERTGSLRRASRGRCAECGQAVIVFEGDAEVLVDLPRSDEPMWVAELAR